VNRFPEVLGNGIAKPRGNCKHLYNSFPKPSIWQLAAFRSFYVIGLADFCNIGKISDTLIKAVL
jgi:hypothetical protein